MRLFTDQDVYFLTIEWLRSEGHDVITARQIGMNRASDEEELKKLFCVVEPHRHRIRHLSTGNAAKRQ